MMASATMTVNIRLRRVKPLLWWLRCAPWLVRLGMTPERAVAIANPLLAFTRVECRSERGRHYMRPLRFPGRLAWVDGRIVTE